jgi:ABC-2 type transport system permease protein
VNVAVVHRRRLPLLVEELRKVPAFLRRDLLTAWSYRTAFVSDWIGLIVGVFIFYFIGRLVDPQTLPSYGGTRSGYLSYVVIGIALSGFVVLALSRVATAIQREQLMGTLESVLLTPTAPATVQIGSVVYDLLYIPLRTALFLLVVGLGFGLDFEPGGIPSAALFLLAFIPFVWGLGIATAAVVMTFRRGAGVVSFGATLLTLASGAFFPLTLLPAWIERIAEYNPMALTVEGIRQALLGGEAFATLLGDLLLVLPLSAASLVGGLLAFRAALRREQRRGTLGLY